jgi:uncharacterized RDD family membrane protein YckC
VTGPGAALAPAGFWRRSAAGLLDALLVAVLWETGAMWLVIGLWWLRGLPGTRSELVILLVAALGLGVALRLVYTVVWLGSCGQTPGRMAAGIAVVNRAGAPPGYGRAVLRWLGGLLSALTLGLVALPWLFARERRSVADRLAGTRVVLRPRALAGESRPGL